MINFPEFFGDTEIEQIDSLFSLLKANGASKNQYLPTLAEQVGLSQQSFVFTQALEMFIDSKLTTCAMMDGSPSYNWQKLSNEGQVFDSFKAEKARQNLKNKFRGQLEPTNEEVMYLTLRFLIKKGQHYDVVNELWGKLKLLEDQPGTVRKLLLRDGDQNLVHEDDYDSDYLKRTPIGIKVYDDRKNNLSTESLKFIEEYPLHQIKYKRMVKDEKSNWRFLRYAGEAIVAFLTLYFMHQSNENDKRANDLGDELKIFKIENTTLKTENELLRNRILFLIDSAATIPKKINEAKEKKGLRPKNSIK